MSDGRRSQGTPVHPPREGQPDWRGVGFVTWPVISLGYGIVYLADTVILMTVLFVVCIGRPRQSGCQHQALARSRQKRLVLLDGVLPIVGWIWALIELGFPAGDEESNQYGPSPN